jgi:hypothetical protein
LANAMNASQGAGRGPTGLQGEGGVSEKPVHGSGIASTGQMRTNQGLRRGMEDVRAAAVAGSGAATAAAAATTAPQHPTLCTLSPAPQPPFLFIFILLSKYERQQLSRPPPVHCKYQ